MELLRSPLALPLYLAAAGLTALGTVSGHGRVLAFFGGLCWSGGTIAALVEGAPLDETLCVTLALLLLSTGFWRQRAGTA